MKYSITEDLFSYQKEDADLIIKEGGNFLDNSEMGTGKTPKALRVAMEFFGKGGKVLVSCPKTLQLEWCQQAADWLGIEASIAKRSSYRKLETLFCEDLEGKESPIFITNHATFRVKRHLDVLKKYPFSLVILDEAHELRNVKTGLFQGFREFLLSKKRRPPLLALTGSPIVNNPADLFSLLTLVKPEEYPLNTRSTFLFRHCIISTVPIPITRGPRKGQTRYKKKVVGARGLSELREQTSHFTIRRTKKEVLKHLPEKYERKVLLTMPDDQYEAYKSMENDLFVRLEDGEPLYAPSMLAAITRLRQLNLDPSILGVNASSSKTDFLLDLLDSMGITSTKAENKLVIFTTFKEYAIHLGRILRMQGIRFTTIHGEKTIEERKQSCELFQQDDNLPIIIGTIKTMGVGLTLTAASNVVMIDRWFNPAINDQAVDRLHRISQKNAVQIILPVNDDSFDASLDRILTKKAQMSSEYLGETDVMRQVLEDLREGKSEEVRI